MADKKTQQHVQFINTNQSEINVPDDKQLLLEHNPSHNQKIKLAPIQLNLKENLIGNSSLGQTGQTINSEGSNQNLINVNKINKNYDIQRKKNSFVDGANKDKEMIVVNKSYFKFYKSESTQNVLADQYFFGNKYRIMKWRTSWPLIGFYLYKFINIMKMNSTLFRVRMLRQCHYDLLNDRTNLYEDLSKEKKDEEYEKMRIRSQEMRLQKYGEQSIKAIKNPQIRNNAIQQCTESITKTLKEKLEALDNVWPPVSVDAQWPIVWEVFLVLGLIFSVFYAPFHVGFVMEYHNYTIKSLHPLFMTFYQVSSLFYLLDILVLLNTTFYQKGLEVKSRFTIIENYYNNYLLIDIISLTNVTLTLLITDSHNNLQGYFYLLDIFRIVKLSKLLNRFSELFNTSELKNGYFQITMIFSRVILLSHFMACINHFICSLEIKADIRNNWIEVHDLLYSALHERYIHGLYYMIMTCITAGVLQSTTWIDQIVLIFDCLILANGFAYLVNALGNIMSEMQLGQTTLRKKMREINYYLDSRGISKDLKNKIKRHYQYLHHDEFQGTQRGKFIVDHLPENLYGDIQKEVYFKHLHRYPIFKNNFSQEFIAQLTTKVQTKTFTPNQTLFLQDDENNDLYFVVSGGVELFIGGEKSNKVFKEVKEKAFFGELTFFTDMKRNYSARTCKASSIGFITRNDMIEIIRGFPQDHEKLCFLNNQLLFNPKSYRMFQEECQSCFNYGHQTQNCYLVQFKRDRSLFLLKKVIGVQKARTYFKRKSKKSKNALIDKNNLVNAFKKRLNKQFNFKTDELKQGSEISSTDSVKWKTYQKKLMQMVNEDKVNSGSTRKVQFNITEYKSKKYSKSVSANNYEAQNSNEDNQFRSSLQNIKLSNKLENIQEIDLKRESLDSSHCNQMNKQINDVIPEEKDIHELEESEELKEQKQEFIQKIQLIKQFSVEDNEININRSSNGSINKSQKGKNLSPQSSKFQKSKSMNPNLILFNQQGEEKQFGRVQNKRKFSQESPQLKNDKYRKMSLDKNIYDSQRDNSFNSGRQSTQTIQGVSHSAFDNKQTRAQYSHSSYQNVFLEKQQNYPQYFPHFNLDRQIFLFNFNQQDNIKKKNPQNANKMLRTNNKQYGNLIMLKKNQKSQQQIKNNIFGQPQQQSIKKIQILWKFQCAVRKIIHGFHFSRLNWKYSLMKDNNHENHIQTGLNIHQKINNHNKDSYVKKIYYKPIRHSVNKKSCQLVGKKKRANSLKEERKNKFVFLCQKDQLTHQDVLNIAFAQNYYLKRFQSL